MLYTVFHTVCNDVLLHTGIISPKEHRLTQFSNPPETFLRSSFFRLSASGAPRWVALLPLKWNCDKSNVLFCLNAHIPLWVMPLPLQKIPVRHMGQQMALSICKGTTGTGLSSRVPVHFLPRMLKQRTVWRKSHILKAVLRAVDRLEHTKLVGT